MRTVYKVEKVLAIAKDLSEAGAAEELYQEIKNLGLEINVLVNDAGFGEYGKFAETDLEKELSMIQLNISSLVALTKLYLKEMVARNEGKILQVASLASFQPTPYLAVYSASKAFVLSFSYTLIEELKETDINLTVLAPGVTDTEFLAKAHMLESKLAQEDMLSPEEVAREGFEALMAGENRVVVGLKNKVMANLSAVLPNELVAKMARKQSEPVKKK